MATATTRKEMFLKKIADNTEFASTPVTIEEMLLNDLSGSGATELPTVTTTDAGKGLKVDAQGKWVPANFAELPAVTVADAGKVLIVDAEGHWTVGTVG